MRADVSGFRAGTATSLLAEAGHDVIQFDDHIDRARALGLLAPAPDRIGSPAAGSVQRPAPG
jgi:hypothetical protein